MPVARFPARASPTTARRRYRSLSADLVAAHDAKLDASFFNTWREDRAKLLKPAVGPTASERLNALKQRVAARSVSSGA